MPDAQKSIAAEPGPQRHGEVESLATQVLSALAQRAGAGGQSLDANLLAAFVTDILRGGTAIRTEPLADLRRQGVPAAALVDGYIPAAARELGDRWCRDELSFADVTIGAARLQAMLRELGTGVGTDSAAASDAPNVMLIVPHDEYHTLGGMTAASQMRRIGVSVCLALGLTEDEILQKVAARQFDLVAISVSCRQRLDSARRLVSGLRRTLPPGVPIGIGGRVADQAEDVCALTGADFATPDAREALRLCGIRTQAGPANDRTGRGQ